MAYVYIIRSQRNGRFYTGYALDPHRRLREHNEGKVKATRYMRPWVLMHLEAFQDATSARRREYQIKSMKNRVYMESLITGQSG